MHEVNAPWELEPNTIVPVGRLYFWSNAYHSSGGFYGETANDNHPVAENYHAYLADKDQRAVFDTGNSFVNHYDYVDWTAFNATPSVKRNSFRSKYFTWNYF